MRGKDLIKIKNPPFKGGLISYFDFVYKAFKLSF